MKNNPYVLQVSKEENADAGLTADTSKTNEEDEHIKISDKEEKKTVVYQESFKMYVENIDKT